MTITGAAGDRSKFILCEKESPLPVFIVKRLRSTYTLGLQRNLGRAAWNHNHLSRGRAFLHEPLAAGDLPSRAEENWIESSVSDSGTSCWHFG